MCLSSQWYHNGTKYPIYLSGLVNRKNADRMTRQTGNLDIPRVNTVKYGKHSLLYLASKIWNDLPKISNLKHHSQISNLVLYRGVVLKVLSLSLPNFHP